MNKEREPVTESGFSEKELDLALDKTKIRDLPKGNKIIDPKYSKKTDKSSE